MVDPDSRVRHGGPAAPAGPPVVPLELSRFLLVAVAVLVLTEVIRAGFPAYGHLARTSGAGTASLTILLAALAGFLAPAIRAVAGARGLLIVGVAGLAAVRLAMQAFSPTLWLAVAGTAFGMLTVAVLYETARGLSGTGFAVAVVGGLTADTAVRLAFGTFDPTARTGMASWAVCLLVVGGAAIALVGRWRAPAIEAPVIGWRDALGAVALGPFLALQILVLASPAFAASSGGLPLPAAGAVVIVAQALSLAFLSSGLAVASVPGGVCVFGGALLGVATAAISGLYGLTGAVAIAVIVVGQALSAWLLAVASRVPLRRGGYRGRPGTALEPAGALPAGRPEQAPAGTRLSAAIDTGGRSWRIDLGAVAGALAVAGVLLPYVLRTPLPLPTKILPGAAGIVLGLLAAIAAARGGPLPARSLVRAATVGGAALLLLVVPAGYALTAPKAPRVTSLPGTFRVVAYDIDQAVDADGRLDPEAVARAIAAQKADVVALQSVGRGWPQSGTADIGAWLARRLGMRLVWGPAADNQFGDAVLSRLPVVATGYGRLPVGGGAPGRGYVWARVDAGGHTADVWSVQLQAGSDRANTRLAEIDRLLRTWSGAPHTVIAGDLGARPDGPESDRLTGSSGLRRVAGGLSPATEGAAEADGLFGSDDLGFDDVALVHTAGPEHLAAAATVRVIG